MKKIIIIFFLILLTYLQGYTQIITEEEKQIFEQMLMRNNIKPNSVNFLKDWSSSTTFKIPIVVDIINHPMKFPQFVQESERICETGKPEKILQFFSKTIFQTDSLECAGQEFKNYFVNDVNQPEHIFSYVEFVFAETDKYFQQAWDSLSFEEIQKLQYLSYTIWQEEQDSLKYKNFFRMNNIKEYDELDIEEDIIPIIKKIDFSSLMHAAVVFQEGFEILNQHVDQKKFVWDKRIEKKSKWGNFCLGSDKRDIYEKEFIFILEPGGNDVYNFEIKTNFYAPYYWVIDQHGNDLYQNQSIAGLFSVIGGLGINFDKEGDDIYQGDDLAFSSIFGYQLTIDGNGEDFYKCGLHSLGASTFGISVLLDNKGNDIYSVTECGEGFGGTLAAGLLLDFTGNDIYFAGGKYLHKPLAPFDYRSLSQGFGFGVRPAMAGGIGLMFDKDGNDKYQGGVYAQGVAYWYALGILIDKNGNDFYDAVYYPQGSGIHLAGGFLFDENGEDHYYSKHGPGQGAAHDYSVGFLVDRAGDDRYSVEGGNGLGLTNSVGYFLDVCGDDRYQNSYDANYGFGREGRNSASLGLFLDTEGDDAYPQKETENNSFWLYGDFGMGFDTLFVKKKTNPVEEMADEEVAEVDSLAEIEEIFGIASEWEVGTSKKRVEKARKILLSRENETAEYIFENKLDTKSGLVFRAMKDFVENSKAYLPFIWKGMEHEDSLCVKNTMSLIGVLKDTIYIDTLNSFVKKKKYLKNALLTLGKISSDRCTEILKDFIHSPSEKIRVITARALLKIDTEKSLKYLMKMKDDRSFLIRSLIRLKKDTK